MKKLNGKCETTFVHEDRVNIARKAIHNNEKNPGVE